MSVGFSNFTVANLALNGRIPATVLSRSQAFACFSRQRMMMWARRCCASVNSTGMAISLHAARALHDGGL